MVKVPGIFISRMMPDGLAESTGLLAVNDEVLEVNGIEVILPLFFLSLPLMPESPVGRWRGRAWTR